MTLIISLVSLRKPEANTEGLNVRSSENIPILTGKKRLQLLMILSALNMPACDKQKAESDHPEITPTVAPSVSAPASYGSFGRSDYRGRFAREFASKLEIQKGSEGFFLPPGYQWKLEEAMISAGKESGAEGEPADDDLRKAESAVLILSLKKLFDEWSEMPLDAPGHNIFRSPYHREVYRHYYFLRFLEVLPDQPKRKGTGDVEKLIREWGKAGQLAWKLTDESPYYGIPKGKKQAGPFDDPFKQTILDLIEEMNKKMPPKGHPNYSSSYESQFRTSTLDMYLPGIYLGAIRDRMKKAEVSADDVGFDERQFEEALKSAFAYRSREFLKSGRLFSGSQIDRRIFNMIGIRFKELSEMEHPLDLYRIK